MARIIAALAKAQDLHQHKMVNIVTSAGLDHRIKTVIQHTAAQAVVGQHPTYQDSGGTVNGLPTICITGYSGPN